jgi:hypothetical protein
MSHHCLAQFLLYFTDQRETKPLKISSVIDTFAFVYLEINKEARIMFCIYVGLETRNSNLSSTSKNISGCFC